MNSDSEAIFSAALSEWTAANEKRDYRTAGQAGERVMNLATDLMVAEANEMGPSEDLLLTIQARACEDSGDWEGALAAYAAGLTIAEQSGVPFSIWKAHDDLASLDLLLERKESALRHQQLATTAARRDDSTIVLRMALTSDASCKLHCGRTSQAKRSIMEGLGLERGDAVTDELGYAWLKILEARYHVDLGGIEKARKSLQTVWPYLDQAQDMEIAAGVHSAVRSWWTVEAACCEIEGNPAGEVAALLYALEMANRIEELPHASSVYSKARLSKILDLLASALWRNGQIDQSRKFRAESKGIRTQLNLPRYESSS